jgi:hypothetical protein
VALPSSQNTSQATAAGDIAAPMDLDPAAEAAAAAGTPGAAAAAAEVLPTPGAPGSAGSADIPYDLLASPQGFAAPQNPEPWALLNPDHEISPGALLGGVSPVAEGGEGSAGEGLGPAVPGSPAAAAAGLAGSIQQQQADNAAAAAAAAKAAGVEDEELPVGSAAKRQRLSQAEQQQQQQQQQQTPPLLLLGTRATATPAAQAAAVPNAAATQPAADDDDAGLGGLGGEGFGVPAAALTAEVAAELAALSVAGMAVQCLAGYSSTGSTISSTYGGTTAVAEASYTCSWQANSVAAAAAGGGVVPGAAAAVVLPLHAAAAWRLWQLAVAMSELP